MAVHNFGSTVDGSAVIEQVPSQGPALPSSTEAPRRPKRGTVGKVRDDATLADLPQFVTTDNGYWSYQTTDIPIIRVSFDDWTSYSVFRSQESMNAAATLSADLSAVDAKADTALATANTALTTAQSIPGATWPIPGTPSTFPPSAHSHPTSQLQVTATVKSLLDATDMQTARAAIGAGTGNGTSDLQLGNTGTTAAPGNHAHVAGQVGFTPTGSLTATDVQGAIVQASQTGGGGTSTNTDVLYASGAYPTQAATPPTGLKVRHFFGPVQYQGPSWPGVLDTYDYAPLT